MREGNAREVNRLIVSPHSDSPSDQFQHSHRAEAYNIPAAGLRTRMSMPRRPHPPAVGDVALPSNVIPTSTMGKRTALFIPPSS